MAKLDGKAAFVKLKALSGVWRGSVMEKEGPRAEVRYELISGGTAVMETLFPGTPHEMRTVYFMDGGDLVLTHYCSMGNQPHLRLSRASTTDELVFEFVDGTNLDPARDAHVHGGRMRFKDADHLEAEWTVAEGGVETGKKRFFLSREGAR